MKQDLSPKEVLDLHLDSLKKAQLAISDIKVFLSEATIPSDPATVERWHRAHHWLEEFKKGHIDQIANLTAKREELNEESPSNDKQNTEA